MPTAGAGDDNRLAALDFTLRMVPFSMAWRRSAATAARSWPTTYSTARTGLSNVVSSDADVATVSLPRGAKTRRFLQVYVSLL